MHPKVAAARQAAGVQELVKQFALFAEQLDRIEAKLDALSGQKPAKAEKAEKAEKPKAPEAEKAE